MDDKHDPEFALYSTTAEAYRAGHRAGLHAGASAEKSRVGSWSYQESQRIYNEHVDQIAQLRAQLRAARKQVRAARVEGARRMQEKCGELADLLTRSGATPRNGWYVGLGIVDAIRALKPEDV